MAVALHNQKGPPMAVWVVGLSSAMNTEKIDQTIDNLLAKADMLRQTLTENM